MSSCGTLRQATRLLEAAGQDNAHLLIDKFLQAGARISDLQDVHPSSLKYIHLSAAPLRHRPPTQRLIAKAPPLVRLTFRGSG